jgi:cell division protein FtsW
MRRLAFLLTVVTILLAVIGIFILYESSSYTALLNIGDKYYFVKNQALWLVLGIAACLVTARFNYRLLYGLALPMLLVTIALLFIVFVPGVGLELKGSHRWIDLGFLVLQPSELLKITLAVYLAAWLSEKEKGRLPAFLILLGGSTALVALEPDMGTAFVVVFTAMFVYFLSGAALKDFAIIGLVALIGGLGLIKLEPYRMERLTAFHQFDPHNLNTTSYHVKQILIALGSGGVTGVGFGNSVQKYAYVPENTTDSIFAIFAEEAGFVGSVVLLSLFFIQLTLGFLIAARAPDKFSQLLAAGIITFLGTQTLINISSQLVLMPLTGIPLPFISYGGSSLIINFMAIGVLLSIARSDFIVHQVKKGDRKFRLKLRRPKPGR